MDDSGIITDGPVISPTAKYLQLSFSEKLKIVKEITAASFLNILSSIGIPLRDLICLYFIGHLEKPLLFAAFGFGVTWATAFGTAIIFGFATGFGTMASQAYGASNYYKLGLLYQRIIVVMSCLIVFLYTCLWFTEYELTYLGFKADLAYEIARFARTLLFDLYFGMLFETTRFYLNAQNIFDAPAYILIFSVSLNVFWCYLFVNVFKLELIGVGIARTMTSGTSALLIYLYARIKNPCPTSWFPWTAECLKEIIPFAKDIASHGSSIYIEWIAFEFTNLIMGHLGDISVLAAHSATMNYMFTNSTFSLGITLAMSVYVGNAAGEGSVEKVQRYAYTGIVMNVLLVTVLDVLMYVFRHSIASFYTNEEDIDAIIVRLMTFYFFGMHADLCCNFFAYLLRTLGQDRFVLKGYIFCYYGIGVTCSIITCLFLGYSYRAVWVSLLSGCYIMLILNVIRFVNLDWEKEIEKIHLEMKKGAVEESSGRYELL